MQPATDEDGISKKSSAEWTPEDCPFLDLAILRVACKLKSFGNK